MNRFARLLLLIVFPLASACSKDDGPDKEISILGTWMLVEAYTSDGSESRWNAVKEGYTYTFRPDGTFTSNKHPQCSEGTYFLGTTQLTLRYECDDFFTETPYPDGVFVENVLFDNQSMYLTPDYMECIEGCSFRFKKI